MAMDLFSFCRRVYSQKWIVHIWVEEADSEVIAILTRDHGLVSSFLPVLPSEKTNLLIKILGEMAVRDREKIERERT